MGVTAPGMTGISGCGTSRAILRGGVKGMKRMLACGALALSLTGCFRMSVRSGAPREGAPVEQGGVSLGYGLTNSNVAAEECQYGLSRVDVYWPPWGPLVFYFTLGIVAPLRVEYVCAEGPGDGLRDAPAAIPPSNPPL